MSNIVSLRRHINEHAKNKDMVYKMTLNLGFSGKYFLRHAYGLTEMLRDIGGF